MTQKLLFVARKYYQKRNLPNLILERVSYDLAMKTREQNRNNKRTEIDWFIEPRAFGWLHGRTGEKTLCPRTFWISIDTLL